MALTIGAEIGSAERRSLFSAAAEITVSPSAAFLIHFEYPATRHSPVLSISFLPWLLLLLGIVLSIPIVSFVETSRQKKALEAAAAEGEGAEEEGEEVFAEDAEAGFGDDGGFPGGGAMSADEGFGQPGEFGQPDNAELAGFDDDAFK